MAKFKKGDRVRVRLDYLGPNTYKTGQIFTVKDNRDDCVLVEGDCIHESNLELLTEYAPITPKVGERYRVLKNMSGDRHSDTGHRAGEIFVVNEIDNSGRSTKTDKGKWIWNKELTTEYLELVEEEEKNTNITKSLVDDVTSLCDLGSPLTINADNAGFYMQQAVNNLRWSSKPLFVTPEPIKKTIIQKTMNAFKKALLSADTKTLIKAGYMDSETLELTSKGQDALNFIVYEKYQKELVAAAAADIREEEAKKK